MTLLHCHDAFDVLDVFPERIQFGQQHSLFTVKMLCQAGEIPRQLTAFGIVLKELRQVGGVLPDHIGEAADANDFGVANFFGNNSARNVHTVEHVADIVENTGSDFGHSGLSRGDYQLLVRALDLQFHLFAFDDL